MRFRLVALVLVLLLVLPSAGNLAAGPIEAGDGNEGIALLAASCSGCHSKTIADDGFAQIYGRPASEIRDAMLAFRNDERVGTVMNRLAKGYSQSEIDLLSNFLAAQPTAGAVDASK